MHFHGGMESKLPGERPLEYDKRRWNGGSVCLCAHRVEGSSLLRLVFMLHGIPHPYSFFTQSIARYQLNTPPTDEPLEVQRWNYIAS